MAFKPGKSGNPQGRPKGALNQTTRAAQELLDGEAPELTRRCIELAKQGNLIALRLCLERLIPVLRELPLSLSLPKVEGAADLAGRCFAAGPIRNFRLNILKNSL